MSKEDNWMDCCDAIFGKVKCEGMEGKKCLQYHKCLRRYSDGDKES